MEPIAETVRMYQDIINTWKDAGSPHIGHFNWTTSPLKSILNNKFHQMLAYIMDNFKPNDCTQADVKDWFNSYFENEKNPEITVEYLESLVPGIIPIAVVKIVLVTQMPVFPKETESWTPFCINYTHLIPPIYKH